MIDLVAMPLELWSMKNLILARKELLNYIENKALKIQITKEIYKFIFKDIFNKYGCIGRMRANQRKLDIAKVRDFF